VRDSCCFLPFVFYSLVVGPVLSLTSRATDHLYGNNERDELDCLHAQRDARGVEKTRDGV
jgi:hypothetical protein